MPKNSKHSRKSAEQRAREQEYKRVRSRVQHRMSEYRVKGYDVSDINMPAIPKRITNASINRLKKITTEYIRKHSVVVIVTDSSTGEATSESGEEYFNRKKKEAHRKAVETRKRRKHGGSDSGGKGSNTGGDNKGSIPGEDYPHIGDLMRQKIEWLIAQYQIENSNLVRNIENWLNNAKREGVIDRLSQITSDQLNDLEQDIRYVSEGKKPKYNGTNALHWALTGKNLTAAEWNSIEEGYDNDSSADKFDEESFNVDFDDEDDY